MSERHTVKSIYDDLGPEDRARLAVWDLTLQQKMTGWGPPAAALYSPDNFDDTLETIKELARLPAAIDPDMLKYLVRIIHEEAPRALEFFGES